MPVRAQVDRRRRARERARQDILLAAAEVFAQRGFESATLGDLARAAGYAAPSLYRYFESKEEILRELEANLVGELIATFDRPVDRTLPLASRLEALVEAQIALGRKSRALVAVVLAGPGAAPRGCVSRHQAGMELHTRHLAAWFRRNAARGELRCPPEIAARAVSGVLHAFFHPSAEENGEPAREARLVVDLALHGVARPGAARPASGHNGDHP
jgi:AcrR family transcriptional regulator